MTSEAWSKFDKLSLEILSRNLAFNMRRRLNPHHPAEDKQYEKEMFDKLQRQDWFELKDIYVNNREDIAKTMRCTPEGERKNRLAKTIEAIDKIIESEIEQIMLTEDIDV